MAIPSAAEVLPGRPSVCPGAAFGQRPRVQPGRRSGRYSIDMATELKTILKLTVPVIVQVDEKQSPLEDILGLGPGAILELTKTAEQELDLLVNNKKIGQGTAVKVGENFGIRITSIGTTKERVEAMGGGG